MTIKKRALLALVPIILFAVAMYFVIQFVADLWWSARAQPLPTITVEVNYLGASASMVADAVAAPIEMQVMGVEQMESMRSICGSDGSYSLTVTFKRGTDLRIAQTLVQNRAALAMPILPPSVQTSGLSVKQKSPGILLIVNLSSPDGSRDSIFLSNYAITNIKDELPRVPGVSDVQLMGRPDQRTRIEIDLKKLADHDLTLDEAIDSIRQQHVQPAAMHGGQFPHIADADRVRDTILKAGPGASIIRLKDVASVEVSTDNRGTARFNGRPVASLLVYPLPGTRLSEVRDEIAEKLAELRKRLPNGISLDFDFDFKSNLRRRPKRDHVWIDFSLPAGARARRERTLEVLQQGGKTLKGMEAVSDVLELSGPPFALADRQSCILVKLAQLERSEAERAEIIQSIRSRLAAEIPDAEFRLRDLSGTGRLPPGKYPIDFAVHGPDADKVAQFAAKLAERLSQNPSVIDVYRNPETSPTRQFSTEIQGAKLAEMGLTIAEVSNALVGSASIEGLDQFELSYTPDFGADWLKLATIRSGGKLVPLAAFAKVSEVQAPAAIARLDGMPMEEITANPAPGISLAAARSICNQLAEAVRVELGLPGTYQLTWR